MATLAYLRTYDTATTKFPVAKNLPTWLSTHIHSTYIETRNPRVVLDSELSVTIKDKSHEMRQLGIYFPHLKLVQLIFWVQVDDLKTDVVDGLIQFSIEVDHELLPVQSTREHVGAGILDAMFTKLTGELIANNGPRRTDLGAIVLYQPEERMPDLHRLGMYCDCEIRGGGYDLQLRGASAQDEENFGRILVVASVLGRSRHMRKRLIEQISDTADGVLSRGLDPWAGVRITSEIQAQNILFRREMNGEGFLNRAVAKDLLRTISPVLQVPREHLEDLAAASESLTSLSQSLFGLAIEDTQRRFGWYGLFFAALSIIFATFATVDIADSSMSARAWVLAALAMVCALGTMMHLAQKRLLLSTALKQRH